MNDREMLELAAKAAGLQWHDGHIWVDADADYVPWNSLEDNANAFSLAVKLKIIITFADGGSGLYVCAGQRLGPFSRERLPVKIFALEEELAATRRVISMAAAEIGRAMT